MAGSAPSDHEQPLAEINVTPLVDVMLVLLVIFMVLAPLFAQALRVDLPRVAAPALTQPVVADLVLHADGHLELDRLAVTPADLALLLTQRLASEPELVVRLGADTAVPYGEVAGVLGTLRKVGITRLAFATRSP